MKSNIINSWLSQLKKRGKEVVLGASLLMMATTANAGTFKLDLQGCIQSPDNGYHVESLPSVQNPGEYINMYMCNTDSYVQGNLKQWAELDMVPHHIVFSNTTGADQNLTFRVVGDYIWGSTPGLRGWDYISELTLDVNATIAEGGDPTVCAQIGNVAVQSLIISDDETTIERRVDVNDYPNGAICVAVYNVRLAIGSSLYTGASLQDYLQVVEGSIHVGKQTLPLPVPTIADLSKTMTAVQGGQRTWTVNKTSSPASINFGNTCDDATPLQKDVNITVNWVKGPVTPAGNVNVTTVISASNTSHRDINISVTDRLYSGMSLLQTHLCDPVTMAANFSGVVCSHTFTIPSASAIQLNDKATAVYIDLDTNQSILGEKNAAASATLQGGGTVTDENATVKDHESITGSYLSYSVATPDSGSFNNYTAGTPTTGDVNWTSGLVADSGSIIFKKTVYTQAGREVSGILSDLATVTTASGVTSNSGIMSINLNASPTVTLTIVKEMNASIIPSEGVDFNFTVINAEDFNETFTIELNQTNPTASITISGLSPAIYHIQEEAITGYAVDGNATRVVDLRLPVCEATEKFTNILANRPAVKVRKLTLPEIFEGSSTDDGWEMTLYKLADDNITWGIVETNTTTAGGDWITLADRDTLLSGTYKIEETMKNGWYLYGKSADCTFTYDEVVDANRSDFECTYANAKYSTIIIHKELEPGSSDHTFTFTQDINASDPLSLGDGDDKTYDNLMLTTYPRFYHVTEDATDDYDLIGLECQEYFGESEVYDNNDTDTDLASREAIIAIEPGETVECTFTNRERGRIEVLKLQDGNTSTNVWTFRLTGPEGTFTSDTNTSNPVFTDLRLIPDENHTLCELNTPIAWDANWTLNSAPVTPTVTIHDTNLVDRCYTFSVGVGETAAFEIDNISPKTIEIGDYVWYDDNNDGIQDQDEEAAGGLTVELLETNGTVVAIDITDINGNYLFENVVPGEYQVRFSGLPTQYAFTKMNQGSDDAIDSDVDSDGYTPVINFTQSDLTIDAGIYCTCIDTVEAKSDSGSAFNTITAAGMVLLTLLFGLYFARREELSEQR